MSEPTKEDVAAMLRLFEVEPTDWRVDLVILMLQQRRMSREGEEREFVESVNDWATNNANALQTNDT